MILPKAWDDLAEYIQTFYGTCSNPTGCICNRSPSWGGKVCVYWHHVEARDWEELRDELKAHRQTNG